MGRANSTRTSASARWCFTAWNDPMGFPNCDRSWAYCAAMAIEPVGHPHQHRPDAHRRPVAQRGEDLLGFEARHDERRRGRLPVDPGQSPRPVERRAAP